ncbi:GNAT family N-acetyltransferase [Nocardia sp. NPDC050406]|uniref:GNAT family N-acetyltransferase n=1 Tax=Nocardia sp. NPDC050406 TaxID=3364318 RepID=UPI00379C35DC
MAFQHWYTRAETRDDIPVVRDIVAAAFERPDEAELVDKLRADHSWLEGLSQVAVDAHGTVIGHALLTRCHIGDTPALCLAPVSVRPDHQNTGVGDAVVRAVLAAATARGERFVVVLGHPSYYPRFGFTRAAEHGIGVSFEVDPDALMAMSLDGAPLPRGVIAYAAPFGI